MAGEQAKIAAVNMERARQQNGAAKLKAAEYVPGNIVKDTTVPAGANNYVSEIPQGRRLRIIDLGGQQAVDFLAFDLADTEIRYNRRRLQPRGQRAPVRHRGHVRLPAPIFWLLCGNEGCPVATSMPM
jgi:uncharacterized protein YcgI (DUF1989 family)